MSRAMLLVLSVLIPVFSSPEPKAQVSFSDHFMSSICLPAHKGFMQVNHKFLWTDVKIILWTAMLNMWYDYKIILLQLKGAQSLAWNTWRKNWKSFYTGCIFLHRPYNLYVTPYSWFYYSYCCSGEQCGPWAFCFSLAMKCFPNYTKSMSNKVVIRLTLS